MQRFLFSTVVCLLTLASQAQDFHTEPSCWDTPRTYHAGAPSDDLKRKIERTHNVTRTPRDNALVSPNGAYKAWVEVPNKPVGNVADQVLYVYSERDRVTRFYIEQAQLTVAPQWINEKLVFVRVVWGREVFTDIIIDVEAGDIIYEEEARWGRNAFEQYRQACNNTCPCDMSGVDNVAPPASLPAAGEVIGHLELPDVLNQELPSNEVSSSSTNVALPIYIDSADNRIEIARVSDPKLIVTNQHEDWKAALVFSTEPGWYQIKMSGEGGRTVWIKAADSGSYLSMPQILTQHLAYLNRHWDGRLWKSPEGTGGFQMSDVKDPGLAQEEYAATFSNPVQTDTGTWLYVTLHRGDSCDRSKDSVVAEGWVPAWSADGFLTGGYYARGC